VHPADHVNLPSLDAHFNEKAAPLARYVPKRTYFRGTTWQGTVMVNSPATTANEIERLGAVALEAEQRYYYAIDTEDPAESSAKRAAASAWLWALDTLNDFRRTHPRPDNRRVSRVELNENGAEAP
jgi:hypothetical protein